MKNQVICIVGEGRSGSTLLDLVLGKLRGVTSVGELRFVWGRGWRDNQLCGCGDAFRSCEFWDGILKGVLEKNNIDSLNSELLNSTNFGSMVRFPMDVINNSLFSSAPREKKLISFIDSIYEEIFKQTGSNIIVDSSKSIPYAYFLKKYSKMDIKFIHFVRDSRAVSYSRQKKKVRKEIIGNTEYMPQVGFVKSSFKWLSNNILAAVILRNAKYLFIKYESFCDEPASSLREIESFLGMESGDGIKLINDDRIVDMDFNHTVSGNPGRFDKGQVKIKLDDKWREKMPLYKKFIVTLITFPLLLKYYGISSMKFK